MTAVLHVRNEQRCQTSSATLPSEVSVQATSSINAQASAFSVTAVEQKASSSSPFVHIVQHEYQQLCEAAEDERLTTAHVKTARQSLSWSQLKDSPPSRL